MSSQSVEIVHAMFEAFQRSDEETLLALADPNVEVHPSWDSLTLEVGRGHEQFLKFWREWPSFWESYSLQPCEFIDAGDKVVVILHERARSRPGFTEVEDEFAHVWTVRDGKVTRVDIFNEKSEAAKAAGLEK